MLAVAASSGDVPQPTVGVLHAAALKREGLCRRMVALTAAPPTRTSK